MKTIGISRSVSWHSSRPWWRRVMVGAWAVMAVVPLLPAAQLTLQHNATLAAGGGYYQGVADSWTEYDNTKNYGGSGLLYIGMRSDGVGDSGILKFDLPAVSCQSIAAATLSLWYGDSSGINYNNTAIKLMPRRIKPDKPWDENTRDGDLGYGVNYQNRLANNTGPWTSGMGGFYDSVDDGNGVAWIKKAGGTVEYAYPPQSWVPFDVRPSVAHWYAGTNNYGWGIYWQGNIGSDSTGNGIFGARENGLAEYGPKLAITYTGAQIRWGGYANAAWDTGAVNWNVGGYRGTYGSGDFVTFPDGAANAGITVTNSGVSPGSTTISNSTTSYTFSGGGIGGGGGLTKNGTGQATLSAANSYSGLTLVQSGRLIVAANNALGATAAGTVVSNGAALGFQSVNYASAEPMTISGAGVSVSGALYAVSGNNTFGGPVTLAADSVIGAASGLGLTLGNAISGGFNLTKSGAGTLTFGGASPNTYGGSTFVNEGTLALAKTVGPAVPGNLFVGDGLNAAIVRLDAGSQLCSACDVTVRTGGLLNLNNFNATIGGLVLSNGRVSTGSGVLTLGGSVATSGNQTNVISGNLDLGGVARGFDVANGAAEDDLAISAAIANGGVVKLGAGTLALGGNSTFLGDTLIATGAVAVASSTALGSVFGGTVVSNGARLELRGPVAVGAESLTLNGSGGGLGALRSVSGVNSWAGLIALTGQSQINSDQGTLTLGATPTSINWSPAGGAPGSSLVLGGAGGIVISGDVGIGASGLSKVDSGTVTLNAANSYTGTTVVSGGELIIGAGGDLNASANVAVIAGRLTLNASAQLNDAATVTVRGGELALGANNDTVGLYVQSSGVLSGSGTLTAATGYFLGNGFVNAKLGAGPVTITNGIVTLGAAERLDDTSDVTVNGQLNKNGDETINALSGGGVVRGAGLLTIGAHDGSGTFAGRIMNGALTKTGAGTQTLSGPNSYTGDTTIAGGTLALVGMGAINNSPNIVVAAAGTFDVTAVPAFALAGGQTLRGNGTVLGDVNVSSGATVAAGGSVGVLTHQGTLFLHGGGTNVVEVIDADGEPGRGFDLLSVAGDIQVLANGGDPFTLKLIALQGKGFPGGVTNFNPDTHYTWKIAEGNVVDFDPTAFVIEDSEFSSDLAGGFFLLEESGGLALRFTNNHPPVATVRTVQVPRGCSAKIRISDLLAENTSDADDDARLLEGISDTSTNGWTVWRDETFIYYTNAAVADRFDYWIRDDRYYRPGDTVRRATNAILIEVVEVGGSHSIVSLEVGVPGPNTNTITFAGIPCREYVAQFATNLAPPILWHDLSTNLAGTNGLWTVLDDTATNSSRYYRSLYR